MQNQLHCLDGLDPDILDAFPGQRMIKISDNQPERVRWPEHWLERGGQLIHGEMAALKTDPIWIRISSFELPFPPFGLYSNYEVEDLDRRWAERRKFVKPGERLDEAAVQSARLAVDPDPARLEVWFALELKMAGF